MENLKINDVVKIKAEWCNSETEKAMLFVVVDVNEATGKCMIQQKDSALPLAPVETVENSMVEKVNAMCLNCGKFGTDCNGTTKKVWTGCVYRTVKK